MDYIKRCCYEFWEEIKMYWKLREVTEKDCRGQLLLELFLKPKDLRLRYEEEQEFQRKLNNHWH